MRKDMLPFLILAFFIFFNCSPSQKKEIPSTIKPKVLVIIFNPIIESEWNKRLTEVLNWNDPDSLAEAYRADLFDVSKGYLDYEIVGRIDVDEYPIKLDGFQYTDETFLKCWRERKGFHQPDNVDYKAIFDQFDIESVIMI